MHDPRQPRLRVAIVTGASSGLGAEYVRRIAGRYDQIWAIARREDRLLALQASVPSVRVFALDLTEAASLSSLSDTLASEKPVVGLLINAAGYGKIGTWKDIPLDAVAGMVDLDCKAAVLVTQLCLPYMEKGSRIMEICSTAAFQPLSGLAVYAAAKAFLLRYSRALRVELRGSGITVTAVCPYWIKDTEFIPVAKRDVASVGYIRHFVCAQRCSTVARRSLSACRSGFAVSTPGIIPFVHRLLCWLLPDWVLLGLWALVRRL